MLLDKLREYYGFPIAEQAEYINNHVKKMSEVEQDRIADKIIESHSKRFGFPDIAVLAKFLNGARNETHKYFWAVCNSCKTEYDYSLNYCPKCFLDKRPKAEWKGYGIKTSETAPGRNVIRYNLPVLQEGESWCVNCKSKEMSYCPWFGEPDHNCSSSDYEYCECKKCCAVHKKKNAEMQMRKR